MKGVGQHLERLLNAATFAEAGEFETAGQLLEERRAILLVLQEDEPPPWLLNTALSMMDRLEAGVDILLRTSGEGLSPTLTRFVGDAEKKGHSSRVLHRPEMVWENVASHASTLPGIVCILVESLEKWGLKGTRGRSGQPPWRSRLPCPLVVATSL